MTWMVLKIMNCIVNLFVQTELAVAVPIGITVTSSMTTKPAFRMALSMKSSSTRCLDSEDSFDGASVASMICLNNSRKVALCD